MLRRIVCWACVWMVYIDEVRVDTHFELEQPDNTVKIRRCPGSRGDQQNDVLSFFRGCLHSSLADGDPGCDEMMLVLDMRARHVVRTKRGDDPARAKKVDGREGSFHVASSLRIDCATRHRRDTSQSADGVSRASARVVALTSHAQLGPGRDDLFTASCATPCSRMTHLNQS